MGLGEREAEKAGLLLGDGGSEQTTPSPDRVSRACWCRVAAQHAAVGVFLSPVLTCPRCPSRSAAFTLCRDSLWFSRSDNRDCYPGSSFPSEPPQPALPAAVPPGSKDVCVPVPGPGPCPVVSVSSWCCLSVVTLSPPSPRPEPGHRFLSCRSVQRPVSEALLSPLTPAFWFLEGSRGDPF